MDQIKFTIDTKDLIGSEVLLKSVRRTELELNLIKRHCRTLHHFQKHLKWLVGYNVLIVLFSIEDDYLMIFRLDDEGKQIKDQVLLLKGDKIYRGAAMTEAKIYRTMKEISVGNWVPTKDYEIIYKSRFKDHLGLPVCVEYRR